MAETSTTTPAEAATPERDRLLATKLHVPHPRPGFLARARLLERLTEATAREPHPGLRAGRLRQDQPAG